MDAGMQTRMIDMDDAALTEEQRAVAELPLGSRIFLEGQAGSGKTTAGIARLLALLEAGIAADEILLLVPQRALARPYDRVVRGVDLPAGGEVSVMTLGGIARNMSELFWPLLADQAGFGDPTGQPTFLTLETAQYVMSRLVTPLIEEEGYFASVTIDRNRLFSQLLDNLNKAALVGFPIEEIGPRLKAAWLGESSLAQMFDEVQHCTHLFRAYCMKHNLLDFSLQVELFMRHLWPLRVCQEYLLRRYRHVIADNIEEDTPATHRMLREALPHLRSAMLIYDSEAGFRRFLGADPETAYALREVCDHQIAFEQSRVMSEPVAALGSELARVTGGYAEPVSGDARDALSYDYHRYYPEMLNWVADEIARLVREDGVPPGEIVVVAPFLSDALRFSLSNRLATYGIATRSHRPSRALREEPAARCLLTLAQLAHPAWGLKPTRYEVAYALMQAIAGVEPGQTIDLVRAQMLAGEAYDRPESSARTRLEPFEALSGDAQERIGFIFGERYDALRRWLEAYVGARAAAAAAPAKSKGKRAKGQAAESAPIELDHFFSLLFGEVLSQRGFGFHDNLDAANVAGNLVDSARNFRRTVEEAAILAGEKAAGHEYLEMVARGLIADQYIRGWTLESEDSVLLAPAYTFLMNNQPVDVQFWLDAGNRGWFERLYQPLTHPYVLSQHWPVDQKWSDAEEFETRKETLYRLIQGLVRRCRWRIYLGLSELGESGYESQGELLQAVQRMLRRLAAADVDAEKADDDV
jgi:hypothetical protein